MLPSVSWRIGPDGEHTIVMGNGALSRTFTGRNEEEAKGRIVKVAIGEFGVPQDEAFALADRAEKAREEGEQDARETKAQLAHARGLLTHLTRRHDGLRKEFDQQAQTLRERNDELAAERKKTADLTEMLAQLKAKIDGKKADKAS